MRRTPRSRLAPRGAASPTAGAAAGAATIAHLGGLGRGLVGILGDPETADRAEGGGVEVLLGRRAPGPARVRQFVTNAALAVIAEGFGADVVVLARRDGGALPAEVTCRMPPSWEQSSWTFELYGRLYRLLEEPAPGGSRWETVAFGERSGWIGRQESPSGDLVAAVVRTVPFGPTEQATLARVVRSVAVAVAAGRDGTGAPMLAEVTEVGGGWVAEVRRAGASNGSASATGPTQELAVARAGALLCPQPCEVAFAGRTSLEQVVVSIVVVNDHAGSPLLGLSVAGDDGTAGPAQAVLAAMAAVDA